MEWLFGNDTGLSSKTIWCTMTGTPDPKPRWPYDPSDFGRCHRLLQRFPEWHGRIAEMEQHGPEWRALVEVWDELEALYKEEAPSGNAPRLYKRMHELIRLGGRARPLAMRKE